jgi:hypothetical protein
MKLSLAKKMLCEVEVFNGDKLVDKYVAVERYAYPMQAPFKLVDDQSNIREIVKKNPYKKDNDNA